MSDNQATPDGAVEAVAPATAAERLGSLDFIRGFAVLGILAANIVAFGQPWSAYAWPDGFLSGHDQTADWLWVAQFVLIDGKMRGLFTVLFGAGMALFMEKAWERGASRSLLARRLVFLLLFGLVHFFLIWRGDILVLYSIAGFATMGFLRWKPRQLLTLGLIGYVMGALFYTLAIGSAYFIADTEMGEGAAMEQARAAIDEGKQASIADDQIEIPAFLRRQAN